jgi:TPR repeat protein
MPQCVRCGRELHPERALKYNYCLARECQEKNARGLTMVAVRAAEAGHTDAQFSLGWLLSTVLDPPELAEARTWFTRAAEGGDTDAQFSLGLLLATRLDPPELA